MSKCEILSDPDTRDLTQNTLLLETTLLTPTLLPIGILGMRKWSLRSPNFHPQRMMPTQLLIRKSIDGKELGESWNAGRRIDVLQNHENVSRMQGNESLCFDPHAPSLQAIRFGVSTSLKSQYFISMRTSHESHTPTSQLLLDRHLHHRHRHQCTIIHGDRLLSNISDDFERHYMLYIDAMSTTIFTQPSTLLHVCHVVQSMMSRYL